MSKSTACNVSLISFVMSCSNVVSGECYRKMKAVLHSALPSDALVGRAAESKVIGEFLAEHLSKMVPGSMYVSGAPGTGKTAVLMKAIERLQVRVCLLDKNHTQPLYFVSLVTVVSINKVAFLAPLAHISSL